MSITLSIFASFFFSITFVLNQLMSIGGGDWLWTASLRFLFMIPFFVIIVSFKKNSHFHSIIYEIKKNSKSWFLWSQVGFGLFYIPLCYASTLAPGWMIASTWQITIVAGSLIAPYIETGSNMKKNSRITRDESILFGIILLGIGIVEFQHLSFLNIKSMIFATLAVLTAAIAYPLGNRKIMIINHSSGKLNTDERILAMLFSSLPTWLVCSLIGLIRNGFPSTNQIYSSFFIALCSGVVATYLFFLATQFVHKNLRKLAAVEAIQSLEVIFSVLLGIILLKEPFPNLLTIVGLILIISGVVFKVLRS